MGPLALCRHHDTPPRLLLVGTDLFRWCHTAPRLVGITDMNNSNEQGQGSGSPVLYVVIFLVVVAAFYGLDHFIMGIQGLPLGLNLAPGQ